MRFITSVLIIANLLILVKVVQVTNLFSPQRQMTDFDIYHQTIQDMRQGVNPYTVSYMQTLGPPITFLYYVPYTFFRLPTAQFVFLVINIFCGYASAFVLARKLQPRKIIPTFLTISILIFCSFLSRYSLQIGQPSLFLTLAISLALSSSGWIRSFCLVILTVTKAFFALSLLALAKLKTHLLRTLFLLAIVTILTTPLIKFEWYSYYLQNRFWQNVSSVENSTRLNYENQTLKSTLTRLHIPDTFSFIWFALFVWGSYWAVKKQSLELGLLLSFLLSPVLWQHYLIALLPLFVWAWYHSSRHRFLILISFLLWWPDLRFLHAASPTLINGLLASHFFISLLLLTFVHQKPRL